MAKKCKNLAIIHFQVDAIHSLEAIRIYLSKILNFQVLVFKLHSSNFWSYWLVVRWIKIFKLKGVCLTFACSILFRQSGSSLLLLRAKFFFLDLLLVSVTTAHGEAEASLFPFTISSWEHCVHIEAHSHPEHE